MPHCSSLEEMRALRNPVIVRAPVLCRPEGCAHAPYHCRTHRLPQYWCRFCSHRFVFPEYPRRQVCYFERPS